MTEPKVVPLGQTLHLSVTFRDPTLPRGSDNLPPLVDPTTVVCHVVRPDGSVLDPAPVMTRDSQGKYSTRVLGDMVGVWSGHMRGTGVYVGVQDFRFRVRPLRGDGLQ